MNKSRLILPGHLKQPTELQKAQQKLVNEISAQRAKILDAFGKAYLASTGLKPEDVVMVQKSEPTRVVFFFERRVNNYPIESKLVVAAKNLLEAREQFSAEGSTTDDEKAYVEAFQHLTLVVNEIENEAQQKRAQPVSEQEHP